MRISRGRDRTDDRGPVPARGAARRGQLRDRVPGHDVQRTATSPSSCCGRSTPTTPGLHVGLPLAVSGGRQPGPREHRRGLRLRDGPRARTWSPSTSTARTWPRSWSATGRFRRAGPPTPPPRWPGRSRPPTIAGLPHGDLQPRNVMVTRDGHVKVTDFGIARAAAAVTDATNPRTSSATTTDSGGRPGGARAEADAGTIGAPSEASDVEALGRCCTRC
jgi:serine/threonine protein kinase